MKELNVKNKLGLQVFINGTPQFDKIPQQDLKVFIDTLADNYEKSIDKKLKNNRTKTIDFNDTT